MATSLSKKVTKTGAPAPGSTVPEGTIIEVNTDEKIVDPNDPRAVQVPEEGTGGGNPLDVHVEPTPNEVFGGGTNYVNPHTGEVVAGPDADATEVSPTPSNVETAATPEEVFVGEDFNPVQVPEAEAKEDAAEEVVEGEPVEPEPVVEPTPVEPAPSE